MTRRWATIQHPSAKGPANRVSKNRHTSYISNTGITHRSQPHFYFFQNVVSITTCFGRPGDTQHIQNTWEDMRNINFVLLHVLCVIWWTILLQPTKCATSMRNFTATLHLQQLHYVPNQQMYINKIHFWFQTFALFWMLYSFFCVIPTASEFSVPTFRKTLPSSKVFIRCLNYLWRWNRRDVPKRRHRKFRRREITQKRINTRNVFFLPYTAWFKKTDSIS